MIGGLREQSIFKNNLPNKLLMSIITVVFNGEAFLEKTIKSVLSQTYNNIEYIIIDGGSTDGTIDIIKKYEDSIDYWISEPDKGIYDAMNKGIAAASEGYLWFINAGDLIYDNHTINNIFKAGSGDIYYGKTALINDKNKIINTLSVPKSLSWKDMSRGMLVSHQSIIIHKSIADLYNLKYRCISDHDWIINALKKTSRTRYVDTVFSLYLIEGFSDVNQKKCWAERFQLMKEHYGYIRYILTYYYFFYSKLQKVKISLTRK